MNDLPISDGVDSVAVDGARAEVVDSYLVSALEQARRALIRTAFNPVIYEILDFGISLYDRDLRLIAEAPGILNFLGANDRAIRYGVDHIGAERMDRGDIILMNYPYWSSAHTSDACLFAPIYKDAAYVLDSTDMHQEGLIFPGTKIVKQGAVDHEIVELVRFNSRLPDLTIGDFHAQVAAIRTAENRLKEVADRFGLATMTAVADRMIERGERSTRRVLSELPHGSWEASDWLDGDGITDESILMHVRVTIDDERFIVDYSGSADAVPGPVNMPIGATEALVKAVYKAIVVAPGERSNEGHYSGLEVIAPPGNLFHAVYPSPTYTLWTSFGVFELIHKALAPAIPWLHASSGGDEPGLHGDGHPSRRRPDLRHQQQRGHRLGRDARPRWIDGAPAPLRERHAQHPHRSTRASRRTPARARRAAHRLRWRGPLPWWAGGPPRRALYGSR